MTVKVAVIDADGSVYDKTHEADQWLGHYVIRVDNCPTCGEGMRRRKYQCLSLARDKNTRVDGVLLEGADISRPGNDGCLVYAEVGDD